MVEEKVFEIVWKNCLTIILYKNGSCIIIPTFSLKCFLLISLICSSIAPLKASASVSLLSLFSRYYLSSIAMDSDNLSRIEVGVSHRPQVPVDKSVDNYTLSTCLNTCSPKPGSTQLRKT